ncbi:MAG TPA: amidase [Dehalococcoidia bacterium]|nr:amidase [Dehalococcoidia bacterium]
MSETPLHFKTIGEIATLLESKQLSPVDLSRTMLERIDALDARLMSYATVMAESAMAQARTAEQEIASGHYRGPLHGVPVAVKDLCYTRGVRTMGGAKVYRDFVPDFDATVVVRLAEAGAVILGKLNLTEGAMGGYHPDLAIPKNPWNVDRWAGASSSGSGVATAAGLCFGSLGSDTGGSIRFPASACGTVGLKPTYGRVSRYGVHALGQSLDHIGPLTRSSADAGIVLQAIAGRDPNDPTTLPDQVPDMLEAIEQGVNGLRIGWNEGYACSGVDPQVVRGVRDGLKVMESLGARIVEIELPDIDPYLPYWRTLCTAEAVVAHEASYPSRREDYGPYFQEWLDRGAAVTGAEYARATFMRNECNGIFRTALQDIDVLACPTTISAAYPVTEEALYGPVNNGRAVQFQRFTVPFDFNGAPTISVPCGLNSEGLPLSLQFVGKHLSEPLLCRIGHAFEQATDWHNLHPPV